MALELFCLTPKETGGMLLLTVRRRKEQICLNKAYECLHERTSHRERNVVMLYLFVKEVASYFLRSNLVTNEEQALFFYH